MWLNKSRPAFDPMRLVTLTLTITACLLSALAQDRAGSPLKLEARQRVRSTADTNQFQVATHSLDWNPKETAIVICDMWDKHWCKGASERVAEMAPRMNEVIKAARAQGVFIIHCPSDTMKYYEGTPERKLAQSAAPVEPIVALQRWCKLDLAHEAPLPIDDSDGGCDDQPQCKTYIAWKKQIDALEIKEGDAVTDTAEAYYLMQQRGIKNVIFMGVHLNMCVLGRPFSIRQMVAQNKNVVLMRDLTDTMYNSRMRPMTNHFRGTDLMIEHVEKYWCPTITSTAFTGKPEFHFKDDPKYLMASAAGGAKSVEDIAGNESVREHILKFKGRGETVEAGGGAKPLSPQEALKHLKVPDDLEIKLAAAEPDVRQPLNINFDERGRMWVVQYLQYPFPAGLKVVKYDEHLRAVFDKTPEPPPKGVRGADKITIFEDKDGDGYFETHKDFVDGLNIATSVLPARDGVWVMNPPYLLFYPDKNHDDIPDGPPEVHLSGFGIEDTHAVANSLTWGPDGWIYGAQGSTCTATVKGIHFMGQAIWRYHPKTRDFEVFAEGGGNTFCVDFDGKGRAYSGTNHGEKRGLLYRQGAYYIKSWGKHGPLTNPNAYGFFDHMPHEGDKARFSHALTIYEGNNLPAHYMGKMLAVVPLQNRVQITEMIPDGSSFKTHDLERLVETDDKWFRPVDIKIGPEGAVYLADWYDVRLTHVDPRDNWDRSNGRIYRITKKGTGKVRYMDLAKLEDGALMGMLSHDNKFIRNLAVELLRERHHTELAPKLTRLVEMQIGNGALAALWALNAVDGFTESFALRNLRHPDPFVRAWVVRLLGDKKQVSSAIESQLVEMARTETEPEVRSQLACSAKRLRGSEALPIIANLVRHDEDLKDPHIPLLLWWALESKAISDRPQVVQMFDTPDSWTHPIVAKEIMHRLAQRYAAEGGNENLNIVAQLLEKAPSAAERSRLLAAVMEAFKGRKIGNIPKNLRKAISQAGSKDDPSAIAARLRLGAPTEEDIATAINLALSEDVKLKPRRIELLQALGDSGLKESIEPLLKVARSSQWHSVRRAALQGLQNFDDPAIGHTIVSAYEELPKDQGVRPTALEVLSRRPSWTIDLVQAVEAQKIPKTDIPFEVVERMKLYHDPAINVAVQKIWGTTRQTPKEKQERMATVSKVLAGGKGDAAEGKKLFTATCATCHKLHGQGQTIGPDLTGYERDNLDFLLLGIVDPNAVIREEYTNFELETKDGLLLTGFITERAAQSVTIEDAQQGRTTVPKERIKALQASAVSRMPEGLLDALSQQQIRDLFAYLRSKAPGL
jgi:putative membrane-bound dehydrogenase-like protein